MVHAFWWCLHQNLCISHKPPHVLIKGLDDRRTNPKFGGAATKILVSSQIAQKRVLRRFLDSEN